VRLCATASVSHLFIPPLCVSLVDPKATLRCASLELRCPIAFIKSRSPFFRLLSKASFARCPASKEDPLSGLATRSMSIQLLDPWKPLSAPHALGLHPSKLCSSQMIGNKSPCFLSVPALFSKTSSALERRLNGLSPIWEAVPLCATGRIRTGRGPCSLGLLGPLRLSLHFPDPTSVSPVG